MLRWSSVRRKQLRLGQQLSVTFDNHPHRADFISQLSNSSDTTGMLASSYGAVSMPGSPNEMSLHISGKITVRRNDSLTKGHSLSGTDYSPLQPELPSLVPLRSSTGSVVPIDAIDADATDFLNGNIQSPIKAPGREFRTRHLEATVNTTKLASMQRRRSKSSIVREKWANKLEFLLAVIGYAVDLGNIWRFPAICYKYGGGAFLIPYLVMLFLGGLPMFYMELALGQYHKSGCISIWRKICPMFKGIGYGICFICTYIACFYNAVIAHSVYFVFSSFQWEVPWKTCNNSWNTELCTDVLNATISKTGERLRTPSEEFYMRKVLESHLSTGFDDLGGVKPSLAFCLFLVFLIVYFALWKGPRSSGKVVWVTATAPYAVLSILLVRGLTLPGASDGIYYYLTPNMTKLLNFEVWTAAAVQVFFSLGPGFGVLLALSSYNDFNNNCHRDALVTSFINCGTSFFAGFVIFSTLGYMAQLTNQPIDEVVGDAGSGLIFVVYPQAIATMSYSPFWSLIFFIMLITLGIDSTFSGIEALITGFCDEYPRILAKRREIFVAVVITLYFFGSLPAVSYGGAYVIMFLDEYGITCSILFIVTCEMVAVCWFYGIGRFSNDIRQMTGTYPSIYWRFCWTCCPVFIAIIFGLTVYEKSFKPLEMGKNYTYPEWSVPLGWFIRLTSVLSVPAFAIYMVCNLPGTITQRFKTATTAQQRHCSMVSSAPSIGPMESQSMLHDGNSRTSSAFV